MWPSGGLRLCSSLRRPAGKGSGSDVEILRGGKKRSPQNDIEKVWDPSEETSANAIRDAMKVQDG